jgi:hypothetical protein
MTAIIRRRTCLPKSAHRFKGLLSCRSQEILEQIRCQSAKDTCTFPRLAHWRTILYCLIIFLAPTCSENISSVRASRSIRNNIHQYPWVSCPLTWWTSPILLGRPDFCSIASDSRTENLVHLFIQPLGLDGLKGLSRDTRGARNFGWTSQQANGSSFVGRGNFYPAHSFFL